ncbi:MAG: MTH1187 family thiamine-binding protein [candidate division Zixibacteria bacterium]|nr:MTH1187 family thiamine-binding protein [candidate division Zixibacteria bacterium]
MLFQLTMFPTSKTSGSASAEVAKVIDIIDRSGLAYKLGPMSTSIEGEWDEVMTVINEARRMLREKHERVYIILTIDDREGATDRLSGKIDSIEQRLGREVRK